MVLVESEDTLERGAIAPDFELLGTDDSLYTLDSFLDTRALLIVFTCNHCSYAQSKVDLLNELAVEFGNVGVVGINPNDETAYPEDSFEKMTKYVDSGRVAYDAYLRDATQTTAAAYGATCTPDPFLFRTADDTFELVYHGRLDNAPNPDDTPTAFPIRKAIDAVLEREPVTIDAIPSRGCSIKWK